MKETKVIIVDDNLVIRDGLRLMLKSFQNIKIVAEAEDGLEALDLIEKVDFDVILMDISMPNLNGIAATKKIKKKNVNAKILANTCNVDSFYIKEMLTAGASGYINKGADLASYKEAIWTVQNGGIFLSEEIELSTYDEVLDNLKMRKAC